MGFDDVIRQTVREVLRDELREALAEMREKRSSSTAEYLTVADASKIADVHEDTIRAWVKAGRLPRRQAGRELRIRRDDLVRFLDGEPTSGERPTPQDEAAAILARRKIG